MMMFVQRGVFIVARCTVRNFVYIRN